MNFLNFLKSFFLLRKQFPREHGILFRKNKLVFYITETISAHRRNPFPYAIFFYITETASEHRRNPFPYSNFFFTLRKPFPSTDGILFRIQIFFFYIAEIISAHTRNSFPYAQIFFTLRKPFPRTQ